LQSRYSFSRHLPPQTTPPFRPLFSQAASPLSGSSVLPPRPLRFSSPFAPSYFWFVSAFFLSDPNSPFCYPSTRAFLQFFCFLCLSRPERFDAFFSTSSALHSGPPLRFSLCAHYPRERHCSPPFAERARWRASAPVSPPSCDCPAARHL